MEKQELQNLLSQAEPDSPLFKAATEALRLHDGIKAHKDSTVGHGMCWINDHQLWSLIEKDPRYPHETLPCREEFSAMCVRYYQSRINGTPYAEPPPKKTVLTSDGKPI